MSITLRSLLVLATAAVAACSPCGHYIISNTTATDFEGDSYNGRCNEPCGWLGGASGLWDWHEESGVSEMYFKPSGASRYGQAAADFEISVGFDTALLVPGTTIELSDMYGSAAINTCVDCPGDGAALAEGFIEVRSGWQGDDPCEPEDGPDFRMHWDLLFGDHVGPTYELKGTDKVVFSTFTTPACSVW